MGRNDNKESFLEDQNINRDFNYVNLLKDNINSLMKTKDKDKIKIVGENMQDVLESILGCIQNYNGEELDKLKDVLDYLKQYNVKCYLKVILSNCLAIGINVLFLFVRNLRMFLLPFWVIANYNFLVNSSKFKVKSLKEMENLVRNLENEITDLKAKQEIMREEELKQEQLEEDLGIKFGERVFGEVENLKDESLEELVNEVESLIIALPNEEEQTYLIRLKEAQRLYKLEKTKISSFNSLQMAIDYKNYITNEFKNKVEDLKEELSLKKYMISNEEYKKIVFKEIQNYLDNIDNYSDEEKLTFLASLMQKIEKSLDKQDLELGSEIKIRVADVIYRTLFKLDLQNISFLYKIILPEFKDKVIYFGELLLDSLEQNLTIYALRKDLYKKKLEMDKDAYLVLLLEDILTLKRQGINLVLKKKYDDNQLINLN